MMLNFIYSNATHVVLLNSEDAFNELTEKEKLYGHYLSRASWFGGLIDLLQTSLESPLIFVLLRKLFQSESLNDLKETSLNVCDFTEEEFKAFLIYACGILTNLSNYKGFGDTKFIPNLPKDKFRNLVLSSKFAKDHPQHAEELLSHCLELIYSLKDKEQRLGFPCNATTTYFSKNVTEEDIELVNGFLKTQKVEPWNTRLFKTVDETGKISYDVRLASVLQTDDEMDKNILHKAVKNGHSFTITRGDYSKLLKLVNQNLLLAKEYAANKNQECMIENYIHSFSTGSIDAHKKGSSFWINDKGPVVESYIGFIETYRDPCGQRAEFRGFVAMVNKPMTVKFSNLVKSAETLLPLLPWPQTFEKDVFLHPDFTSLDVLTFANSRVPSGINIPNYNDIRQTEGFKNVSLGNTMQLKSSEPPNYLNKADQDLLLQYAAKAFDFTVGLHELLGHGSGKLFQRTKDGIFNFDVDSVLNFETAEKISSWYEEGDTYSSVFGKLGSSYEECRAESVALYLCDQPKALKIFGYEGQEAEDITYSVWLCMVLSGLGALSMYDPKSEKWMQAHSQARYVIFQVLLECHSDLISIEKVQGIDGSPDILLTLDRSKIITVGKPSIGKFLGKLQLFKATADVSSAEEMYNKYSVVPSNDKYPFLEYRKIIMSRAKPRRMFVQANTYLEDGHVKLKNYESSFEGLIQSWIERLQDENVEDILEELWAKDKHYFS